jgi:hypothetical protein
MFACAIAYVFVLQATLAGILSSSLPIGSSLPSAEFCLSQPVDPHPDAGNGVDTEHVKAAGRCSLCLVPAFGLLLPPTATAVLLRAALGIAYEPLRPARIALADVPSAHRARAPPALI